MLDLYAQASCMLLASLATVGYSRYRGDLPRCFWEEQFGMVLAEAMAAGLPIVASASGAIREVVGDVASYFTAGRLARAGPAPCRGAPVGSTGATG